MFSRFSINASKGNFLSIYKKARHISAAASSTQKKNAPTAFAAFLVASSAAVFSVSTFSESPHTLLESSVEHYEDESTTIINWSGTHSVDILNDNYYEPETIEDLERFVADCHKKGKSIRPVGSALSPNAISFNQQGMVSLANLDRIVKVDKENMTCTVEAGARISQVIDALREHGMTLPNLASIAEQQVGGFFQIGAHGTGALISPVDDFITKIKMVTPARGTVELTPDDGEMFDLAKVGLGCLGVVSEVTMQCVPAHNLVEHTYVLSRAEAKSQVNHLLRKHKHIRYMWIPYSDTVVVVTNDPEDENSATLVEKGIEEKGGDPSDPFGPFKVLLNNLANEYNQQLAPEDIEGKGFGELRDKLLSFGPLNSDVVKRVNQAEALFWRNNEGYQLKPSDQLLQFDCGGQQWVFEVCFNTGSYENNNGNDMLFMENILDKIESQNLPAPAPIEQRWSASSSSLMSPAHGEKGGLHCWVGIIMYLPTDDENERAEISKRFKGQYCDLSREVGEPMNAVSHWGKLEMPSNGTEFLKLRKLMLSRYPLASFNAARAYYDPKNVLGNPLLDTILGKPH
jgi:L-galactono-1,4-lactone dehydrogenase